MDIDLVDNTRQSLHKINNELSIASLALELIMIKLEREPTEAARDELLHSCSTAIGAIKRAGKTAHASLSELHA